MNKKTYLQRTILFLVVYVLVAYFAYLAINKSPCDSPVTYSIGKIDSQFGISKSDVEQDVTEASSLWNGALKKTLLKEDLKNPSVVINFVFDERQRATIRANKLKQIIDDQKKTIDNIVSDTKQVVDEYNTKKAIFDTAKTDYETKLSAYESSVNYWNGKGGAPEAEYNKLIADQKALDIQHTELTNQYNELQDLYQTINTYNEQQKNVVNGVNSVINQINQNAGNQFEEGVYDSGKKTITIYEYDSALGLKRVLTHELGHALGLDHVANKDSIMYYLNNSDSFKLSNEDISALKKVCKIK